MKNAKTRTNLVQMAQLAILIAIMLLLAFTPIGYLKAGVIEITFMVLPVAVGATLLGPLGGAVLGGVFGLTSFLQCFGMSPFGTFLFGLNPVLTFLTCVVPRILCGLLSGLFFRLLQKWDRTHIASYFFASLSTALLNTLFFTGALILFFWHNPLFLSQMTEWGMPLDTLWVFLVAFVGLNGLVEAIANAVLGGAIGKALSHFVH